MYLALYRKYRPTTFEDVIGQPHITTTLKNEVALGHTAHAYLFTGPRGTGKTTCSKVLAMAVNCENPVDGNPCLQCQSCKAIDEATTLDVVEIDAASNNGVDNIRDLRDEASYTPTSCKYRVYIIDETHMLSAGAFNALLKIMEEPPPHVKFILATTEAHKVPATILSRCQRFDFRRIKSVDIEKRLLEVAEKEPFSLEKDAAELIARLADGGMRDAYSLLDQCAAYSNNVNIACVAEAAGVVGREYLFDFTDCIVESDPARAVMLIDKLYSMSKDLQGLLEELLNHLRNIMLAITLKNGGELISALPGEMDKIRAYTTKLPLEKLLYALSQLQACLDKMSKSADKRLTLELCMIKLCTPSMNIDYDAILSRLAFIEARLANTSTAIPTILPQAPLVKAPETAFAHTSIQTPTLAEQETPAPIHIQAEQIAADTTLLAVSPPSPTPPERSDFSEVMQWADIMEALSKVNPPLYGALNGARAMTSDGFLYLETQSGLTGTLMKQEGNASKLVSLVEEKTGIRYKIRMKTAPIGTSSRAPNATSQKAITPLEDILNKAKSSGVEITES